MYFCCCHSWNVIIFIKYNTQLTKEIVQRLNSLHECPMSLRLCSTRFTRVRSVSNPMICSFISGLVTSQQKIFNSSLSNISWLFSYMDSCISIISISPECFVFIRKRITEDTQRLLFCFGMLSLSNCIDEIKIKGSMILSCFTLFFQLDCDWWKHFTSSSTRVVFHKLQDAEGGCMGHC